MIKNSRALLLSLAALGTLGAAGAPDIKTPPQVEASVGSTKGHLANVGRLINDSSAAARIDASNDEKAAALKKSAQDDWEKASLALESGRLDQANQLLVKATQSIFEAVHVLGPAPNAAKKKTRDFADQANSVEVLASALERIAAEKKLGPESESKARAIHTEVARARSLVAQGDIAAGRRIVDEAYESARSAVEDLRRGDVVVKALNFETPEDEYRYEIDRNDTHKMLIRVLLDEKRGSESVDSMVRKFIERSEALRQRAESEAAKGDHDTAIDTLEESTQELLRAIRGAGVYIPG